MSRYQAKIHVKHQIRRQQTKQNILAASTKSKVRDLVIYKQRKDIGDRSKYLSLLNRTDSAHIFRVRSRMIKVKGNYRGMHTDMSCRWCFLQTPGGDPAPHPDRVPSIQRDHKGN